MIQLAAIAFALLLPACNENNLGASQILPQAPHLEIEDTWSVQVDAVLPTDVLPQADGGVLILDGYHGRAIELSPDHQVIGTMGSREAWGRPERFAPAHDGGYWLVDPTGPLLRVGTDGDVVDRLELPDIEPMSVLDRGEQLIVSDRTGSLLWIDRATGKRTQELKTDYFGRGLGSISDLALLPGGQILASDPVAGWLDVVGPDAKPLARWGRPGLGIGYLHFPKSAIPVGDAYMVADSALGAVQLFDQKGHALGVLSSGGQAISLQHPVAVRAVDAEHFLVLDAGDSRVLGFKLPAARVADAVSTAPLRWLRETIKEPNRTGPGTDPEGSACLQCHDGLFLDARDHWDPKLGQHPKKVPEDVQIPTFFQRNADGTLECSTCHSPHGMVSLSDVEEQQKGEVTTDLLVRHGRDSESFTRLGRRGSELCIACHTEAPHDKLVEDSQGKKSAHLAGKALMDALAKRPGDHPEGRPDAGCLGCHDVHGAPGEHLTRDASDGRVCAACHEDKTEKDLNHPLGKRPKHTSAVADARIPTDEHGGVTCISCHDAGGGRGQALLRESAGSSICASCHTEQSSGAHRRVKGDQGVPCLGCHKVHASTGEVDDKLLPSASASVRRGAASTHGGLGPSTKGDPQGCLGCHTRGGAGSKAGVAPRSLGHPVDGRSRDGAIDPLQCATCHDQHDPLPPKRDCSTCHEEQSQAAARGGHGRAECLDCHPAHRAPPKAPSSLSNLNPRSQTCLACHAPGTSTNAPKVPAYEHPAPVFTPGGERWTPLGGLPLFAGDGTKAGPGANGDLVCDSCHEVHGPDASEKGDSLRRPGWKEVCGSCHGPDALVYYRYFHQPERRAEVEGVKP